jgi:hypothetical protein
VQEPLKLKTIFVGPPDVVGVPLTMMVSPTIELIKPAKEGFKVAPVVTLVLRYLIGTIGDPKQTV